MNIRQISISEFKAHCTEHIREVEKGNLILQVTRHGKPVAIVEQSKAQDTVPLANWLGAGRGSVTMLNDEVLTAPVMAWHEDVEDVWTSLTAEEHARRQGIGPIGDPRTLLGNASEEDWDGFDEWLETRRRGDMIQPLSEELP